mmetsp:Transcript_8104/g.12244  ORF Transcript_8104/g.12244 Transcript_8104/m.12244 type:complete len:98 (-) Transcript_8104:317-610(-)
MRAHANIAASETLFRRSRGCTFQNHIQLIKQSKHMATREWGAFFQEERWKWIMFSAVDVHETTSQNGKCAGVCLHIVQHRHTPTQTCSQTRECVIGV